MKQVFRYFFQGVIFVAPIVVTVYIIVLLFGFIDGLLEDVIFDFLGMRIPGLGLLIMFGALTLVGLVARTLFARTVLKLFNELILRIPVLNVIYSAFNDLFAAFAGDGRKFQRPVIVLVNPVTNLEKMGFVTEDDLSAINELDKVAVYFPHSYNFSGEMFIVPKSQIRELNIPPGDAMKFVVSGGVAGIRDVETQE